MKIENPWGDSQLRLYFNSILACNLLKTCQIAVQEGKRRGGKCLSMMGWSTMETYFVNINANLSPHAESSGPLLQKPSSAPPCLQTPAVNGAMSHDLESETHDQVWPSSASLRCSAVLKRQRPRSNNSAY